MPESVCIIPRSLREPALFSCDSRRVHFDEQRCIDVRTYLHTVCLANTSATRQASSPCSLHRRPGERGPRIARAKHERYGLPRRLPKYRPSGLNAIAATRSRREPNKQNSIPGPDLMGLTGVTLEATKDPAWATKLSDEEARRATEFATLEINGFPRWLSDLVASHPAEVRTVLHHEIKDELTREGVTFFETLECRRLLGRSVWPRFWHRRCCKTWKRSVSVPHGAVSLMLQIIVNGLAEPDRERFERWGICEILSRSRMLRMAVQYLSAVFSFNPTSGNACVCGKSYRP